MVTRDEPTKSFEAAKHDGLWFLFGSGWMLGVVLLLYGLSR